MTFPYKTEIDKCVGSCNDKDNPYFKVCTPDIAKNISVKVLDLISKKNLLKNITFHKSCKCDCLLDEKVCNNKQRWNKDKFRCEYLEIKECDNNSFWNVVNCRCEFKKAAKLIVEEECDVETSDIVKNKTTVITKEIENCKPYIAASILFISVSIMTTGIMTYCYCMSRKNDGLLY